MATLRWLGHDPVRFMGHPKIGVVAPGDQFHVPDEIAETFHRRADIELVSLDGPQDAAPEDAVPQTLPAAAEPAAVPDEPQDAVPPRTTEQRGDALITKPTE